VLAKLVKRWSAARAARPRRFRAEHFGGIAQLSWPRMLVFVDRQFARSLGVAHSQHWSDPAADGQIGHRPLRAPLEAHLQLTNRCSAGCKGCYTAATAQGAAAEWGLAQWKAAVDTLADQGVFHLALGGGESALLPWLGELARYARRRGLIPNLTTSGLAGLANVLACAGEFGQINVSIDGLGATYAAVRGFDGFARADDAVRQLRAVKRAVGINVVVTRHNFDQLDQLFAYARRRRLNEVELLRFKPAGRGCAEFAANTCTDAQHRQFLPRILSASRRHRVRARVDCSYTPMIAHHAPDPQLLASLTVYGCTGGDFLVGAKASGVLTACSFAAPPPGRPRLNQLPQYWNRPDAFGWFRQWRTAPEPCASCTYLPLCRGGCAVVSSHVCGDPSAPDPECPRVVDLQPGPTRNAARRPRHFSVLG
jgi:radical SAM protein with 4Fe4S-binding SPASM domain